MKDQYDQIRSIIRKDLDSVGMIPTGTGIQLVCSNDPLMAMALIIESIYVQIFNDRDFSALMAYLMGPMLLNEEKAIYFVSSAFRVRGALGLSRGNGKMALDDLMKDKGADSQLMKTLLTICFNVSKEYRIPFDKKLAAEIEFEKIKNSVPDGEIVNDSYSTSAPHVKASFLRILKYDNDWRGSFKFAVALIAIVLFFIVLSLYLFIHGRYIWGSLLALPVLFFGKSAFLMLFMLPMMISRMKQTYFSALLTAGVIVSVKPLRIACLVNIGNGSGKTFYGLKIIEIDELPEHKVQLNEFIPCVSTFESGENLFRWKDFTPSPISWGTSSAEDILRCKKKIDLVDFENALKTFREGKFSKKHGEIVILNEKFEIDN